MDKAQLIVSLLLSIVTLGTAIYKIGLKNSHNRENKYYEEVLKPYIVELVKNEDINTIKYVKTLIRREYDYIPKYIYYLIDNNKELELKKVLIMDYT